MKEKDLVEDIKTHIVKILTKKQRCIKILMIYKPRYCHISCNFKTANPDHDDIIFENIIKNERNI